DIIKVKGEIDMAATLLQEISQDEHEKARIRSRRMYEMDKYSDYHTAIEIGEIKGAEKVLSLLKEGVPIEEIEETLIKKRTS
ncbi:MAG: hypothetical protein FWD22_01630, partial [Treponema sp.]|nr:hypothetical protein [Treponema sp.]